MHDSLSFPQLKALKPKGKPYKVTDGRGLSIEIQPTGSKLWRYRYRYGGKENKISFGPWPEVTIAEAREACDAARKLLRAGSDPSAQRKAARAAQVRDTQSEFAAVANEWLDHQKKSWAPETYRKAKMVVDTYLVPALRRHSIGTLRTPDVLGVLTTIATARAEPGAQGAAVHWRYRYSCNSTRPA